MPATSMSLKKRVNCGLLSFCLTRTAPSGKSTTTTSSTCTEWCGNTPMNCKAAYVFRTKQELLSSELAEKSGIILMWWSDHPGVDGADNHIGFFWGEASDDDVMWYSGTEPTSGNQISAITFQTPDSFYILVKAVTSSLFLVFL